MVIKADFNPATCGANQKMMLMFVMITQLVIIMLKL